MSSNRQQQVNSFLSGLTQKEVDIFISENKINVEYIKKTKQDTKFFTIKDTQPKDIRYSSTKDIRYSSTKVRERTRGIH